MNGPWPMEEGHLTPKETMFACSKGPYPLPSIDRLVDGASGHSLLSFMDAYSGYNQIHMHLMDEVKTAFILMRVAFAIG
ncbi:hypothetical protein CR513_52435, partial [Mucuna pruriens]